MSELIFKGIEMLDGRSPHWLQKLERKLGWLAIPNIAILVVTLQALGFLFVMMDPVWLGRLALIPEAVVQGEVWRTVTFLAIPLTLSPIFAIFTLWFLYFIVNLIETEWGAFRATLYIFLAIILTAGFSLSTGYPITEAKHFESTLFLAAAALFPNMQIQLFFAIPVKIKYLAWFAAAMVLLDFVRADMLGKAYLLVVYANYLVFFGPAHLQQIKQVIRRRKFKRL